MWFHAASSKVPDSSSQRQDIDFSLGRPKISSAERLKHFTRDHWEPSSASPWLPPLPRKAKAFSCSWMGKNQRCSAAEAQKKHGFISFDGLAEHTRKHRHGCGHSKLDLALPRARISQMSITKANTTIKPNSSAWCIFLHVIPFPNGWINTFIEFN